MLTRLGLHFEDFFIRTQSVVNPMGLEDVAAQLRDAVTWWGFENPSGVYTIDIAHTNAHDFGEPAFVMGAKVDPEYFNGPHNPKVPKLFLGEEKVSEKITGTINLNAPGTLEAIAVFQHTHEIIPSIEATRTFTIKLSGTLVPTGAICGTSSGGPQDSVTKNPKPRAR